MIKIPKNPSKKFVYELLEEQYEAFNHYHAISEDLPDPLGIAREFQSDKVALFCALFAYGNARAIVRFLESCNLRFLGEFGRVHLIESSMQESKSLELKSLQSSPKETNLQKLTPQELALQSPPKAIPRCTTKPYRFQTNEEIQEFFIALLASGDLHATFYRAYKSDSLLKGIEALQNLLYSKLCKRLPKISQGLEFLIGKPRSNSPLKRWNMFLRWVVRKDCIDLGLWEGIRRSDLILPLDTHTFRVTQRLGILKRRSYDLKAALEVSEFLKKLDSKDPIKYDFALYRIGQLGLI